MNKTLLPLVIAALAGAHAPVTAMGTPHADLITPDRYHHEYQSRAGKADTAYAAMETAAQALQQASRTCSAAKGAATACSDLPQARERYQEAVEVYDKAANEANAYRGHLRQSVDKYRAQGCDPRNPIQSLISFFSDAPRRNCESNVERYQGYLRSAEERERGLAARAAGLNRTIEQSYHQALAPQVPRAAATPPSPAAADDSSRQATTDLTSTSVRHEATQQTAIDSLLGSDEEDGISCRGGGTSMFGLGVQCGSSDQLGLPGSTSAPAFVPTSHLAAENVLGGGAVVMQGDTLGHIAQEVRRQMGRSDISLWGPGGMVDLLAAANGTDDPDLLHPKDGVRVPTLECLSEAADTGGSQARQALSDCEALVRVSGVPEDLSGTLRLARERIAELERERGEAFSDSVRQEILQDAANTAASPASDFAGVGPGVPAADFIRAQTERFGEEYRYVITQAAADAEARRYDDDERFRLLYRRLREVETSPF